VVSDEGLIYEEGRMNEEKRGYWDEKAETIPPERLKEHQLSLVSAQIKYAYNR